MGNSCFRDGWLWCRGWRENMAKEPIECRICEIIKQKEDMVYEDDEFYVFRDQFPAARKHLLIVPKKHIPSVYSLLRMDPKVATKIVKRMYDLAKTSLPTFPETSLNEFDYPEHWQEFGFHLPPGISIKHLHLHAFELPHSSFCKSLKYIPDSPFFVSPQTIIKHLAS